VARTGAGVTFRGAVDAQPPVDRPVVVAAAGATFAMTDPFSFSIDPGMLLDDEGSASAT
jgi:hypothetical protein